MANGNRTFIKVTNRDILDKLEKVEATIIKIHEDNRVAHEELKSKAQINFWIASTALAMALAAFGSMTYIIVKG